MPEGLLQLTGLVGETELVLFGELLSHLDRGEASVLAMAQHRQWTLLTDDRAARNAANDLGVRVSGTSGCVIGLQ